MLCQTYYVSGQEVSCRTDQETSILLWSGMAIHPRDRRTVRAKSSLDDRYVILPNGRARLRSRSTRGG